MDQYNRLLDVFSNDVNNTTNNKVHQKLKDKTNISTNINNNNNSSITLVNDIEFSTSQKVNNQDSKSIQQQRPNSILSSIINKADKQVRHITGPSTTSQSHTKTEMSTTTTTTTNTSRSTALAAVAQANNVMNLGPKKQVVNPPKLTRNKYSNNRQPNDDTSFELHLNEQEEDDENTFEYSPRKLKTMNLNRNRNDNNLNEHLRPNNEFMVYGDDDDDENLFDEEIDSDRRKIKLIEINTDEEKSNQDNNDDDDEQVYVDDTDMIFNTENDLAEEATEYDNVDEDVLLNEEHFQQQKQPFSGYNEVKEEEDEVKVEEKGAFQLKSKTSKHSSSRDVSRKSANYASTQYEQMNLPLQPKQQYKRPQGKETSSVIFG